MKIGVPKEIAAGERRVALVPEVVRKLVAAGHDVAVEPGAGLGALIPDGLYINAGAGIGDPWSADVVVKVAPPSDAEIGRLAADSILIGFLAPRSNPELVAKLKAAGVTAFAMEAVPRISRAQ